MERRRYANWVIVWRAGKIAYVFILELVPCVKLTSEMEFLRLRIHSSIAIYGFTQRVKPIIRNSLVFPEYVNYHITPLLWFGVGIPRSFLVSV